MKILVTGIYGFLGFNLANSIVENFEIFGLFNHNKRIGLDHRIKVFSSISQLNFEPDIVVLCHASVASGDETISDEILERNNVEFTKELIGLLPNSQFVFFSTVGVFGTSSEVISEVTAVNPQTNYAISKLKAENLINHKRTNIIIRLSSLYGIGMKENTLIPKFCKQAIEHQQIQVWGDGSRMQNYIHVDDVIQIIKKIIDSNIEITFPILGVHSKEYSNIEVAKIIANYTDSKVVFVGEDFSASSQFNNNFSKLTLNWQPNIDLKVGILEYLKWKKKQS